MLRRRTPLRRSGSLKRSGRLKRSRLNPISRKRAAILPERRAFEARILTERPICELCGQELSTDVHEKLTRGRGGSILDPDNVLALGRRCHNRVHDNPKWATERGLLVTQYVPRDRT